MTTNNCSKMTHLLLLASIALLASGDPKPLQPVYNVSRTIFEVAGMDGTDKRVYVYRPVLSGNRTFSLLAYAHGFAATDPVVLQYDKLLSGIASFGFIVVAPAACRWFCLDDRMSLHGDPPFYGNYYKNQLNAIRWATTTLSDVDQTRGVGVVGHSMGGQSTLFSSSYANASQHNIKAAVMLHAFTHEFPSSTVPFMVFTGDKDKLAPAAKMAKPIFDATSSQPRVYVNRKGATHDEPDHHAFNPLLPQFVAAFLKLYVAETTHEFGLDFRQMIFGNQTSSLCGGGDGELVECIAEETARTA